MKKSTSVFSDILQFARMTMKNRIIVALRQTTENQAEEMSFLHINY